MSRPDVRLPAGEVESRATACVQEKLPGARICGVEELKGGASGLTYVGRVEDSSAELAVIKVAPAGLAPVRNRDVLRQARLFSALSGQAELRVPQVYGTDAGQPPTSPPLFVMSHFRGDSFEPISGSNGPGPGPAAVEQRGLSAARLLAHLHRVDHRACGLTDEPALTLSDEVEHWTKALATCEGELHPEGIDGVGERLVDILPEMLDPVITHGDYRLGNMLSDGAEIRAVIDWEIWSLNDPRVDLGWFLAMSDPRRPDATGEATGMPSPGRLAREYEEAIGAAVEELAWFTALARYKEVAVLSLILKREVRSGGPGLWAEGFARRIPRLVRLAVEALDEASVRVR